MKRILLVALSVLIASFLVSRPGDSAAEPSSSRADDVTKSRIQAAFFSSPLRFEANQGQADGSIKGVGPIVPRGAKKDEAEKSHS